MRGEFRPTGKRAHYMSSQEDSVWRKSEGFYTLTLRGKGEESYGALLASDGRGVFGYGHVEREPTEEGPLQTLFSLLPEKRGIEKSLHICRKEERDCSSSFTE